MAESNLKQIIECINAEVVGDTHKLVFKECYGKELRKDMDKIKKREQSEIDVRELVKDFFLGEFVFDELIYTPEKLDSNIELADVLISYADIVIGFQIKARNESANGSEKNWLEGRTKEAKHQVSETLKQLNRYNIPCFNNQCQESVTLPSNGHFLGIVILKNSNIDKYKKVVTTKDYDGNINCFEYDDFKKCCNRLLLPQEIIEYLSYRGTVCQVNKITTIEEDILLDNYLQAKYGVTQMDNDRIEMFRQTLRKYKSKVIDKHKLAETREMLSILLKMDRHEIEVYCSLLIKTRDYAKKKRQQEDLMIIPAEKDKTAYLFISMGKYIQDYVKRIMILFMYKTQVSKCLITTICFDENEKMLMYHYYCEKKWQYDEVLEMICKDSAIKNKWIPKKISTGEYIG
jgi:hypothetical protein